MKKQIGKLLILIGKLLGGSDDSVTPVVEPVLIPAGTIDLHLASSILLDKIEELGDNDAEIYLPDIQLKVYSKDDVLNSTGMKEVSKLVYIREEHDCDDFAAKLFAEFAGLIWTNKHALNWFISDNKEFWWIEPQSGTLSQTLSDWQGSDIRFFVGR